MPPKSVRPFLLFDAAFRLPFVSLFVFFEGLVIVSAFSPFSLLLYPFLSPFLLVIVSALSPFCLLLPPFLWFQPSSSGLTALSPFLLVTVSTLSPFCSSSCLPSCWYCVCLVSLNVCPSCWSLCPPCLPSVLFLSPFLSPFLLVFCVRLVSLLFPFVSLLVSGLVSFVGPCVHLVSLLVAFLVIVSTALSPLLSPRLCLLVLSPFLWVTVSALSPFCWSFCLPCCLPSCWSFVSALSPFCLGDKCLRSCPSSCGSNVKDCSLDFKAHSDQPSLSPSLVSLLVARCQPLPCNPFHVSPSSGLLCCSPLHVSLVWTAVSASRLQSLTFVSQL